MNKKLFSAFLSIITVSLVACNNRQVTYKLTLDKNELEIAINQNETLNVLLEPNNVDTQSLIWKSSDLSVATVDSGTVIGLQAGTTEITVYVDLNNNQTFDVGEPSDKCALTVSSIVVDPILVDSVLLNKSALNLIEDDKEILVATVLPENATIKTITWLSSNLSIATIANGTVAALKEGNATVTAYVDENKNNQLDSIEKFATVSIAVKAKPVVTNPIAVSSVSLNKANLSLEEGGTSTITATVSPSNATLKTVTWLSSNTSVATINNGTISALKAGTTVITAYVDENGNKTLDGTEKSATLYLTVTQKDNNLEPIPPSGESLPIGNKTVSGPSNLTPIEIAHVNNGVNFDLKNELPQYWSYITGNQKHSTGGDFYQDEAGGFKFSKTTYGLQSPLITSWLKVEIKIELSQIRSNNESKPANKDKPVFHIYAYDKTGKHIDTYYANQLNNLNSQSFYRVYVKNTEMAYFEVRLNAFPCDSNGCYNIGVDTIRVVGYPYE